MNFYVTLPSDSSSKFFPENTVSRFTTKLPREVVLDGSWECGVTEFRYPLSFFNVKRDEFTITKDKNSIFQTTFQLPPGFYRKHEVIAEINKFLAAGDESKIEINKYTGKAIITTGERPLHASQPLYDFLGRTFTPRNTGRAFQQRKEYIGTHVVNGHLGFDNLYVYCDILEPRIVGDTTASLLVTMENARNRFSFGDIVTTRFSTIRYYPVAKRRFHTIRIDILTDLGQAVRFEEGKVFIEVHFRQVYK